MHTPDYFPHLDPRVRVKERDVDDVVANVTDRDVTDLLDRQVDVVVLRNQHGTRVLMHQDPSTGAFTLRCTPRDGTEYELLVGPSVPFRVLTQTIEEA